MVIGILITILILFIGAIVSKKIFTQYTLVFFGKALLVTIILIKHSAYFATIYAVLSVLSGLLILMTISKLSRHNSGNRFGTSHLRNQLIGFLALSFIAGTFLMFLFEYNQILTANNPTYLESESIRRTFLAVPTVSKAMMLVVVGVLSYFSTQFLREKKK